MSHSAQRLCRVGLVVNCFIPYPTLGGRVATVRQVVVDPLERVLERTDEVLVLTFVGRQRRQKPDEEIAAAVGGGIVEPRSGVGQTRELQRPLATERDAVAAAAGVWSSRHDGGRRRRRGSTR